MPRVILLFTLLLAVAAGALPPGAAQAPPTTYRVLSRDGTRALSTVSQNNQDYASLEDLASLFGLSIEEDQLAGGVTVTAQGRSIILTPDQGVVSVAGRLVSLSAPVARDGARWLVPVDFVSRALGPALQTRLDVRRASRLIVVGDLRVPRVVARVEPAASHVTVTFEITPATPTRLSRLDAQAPARPQLLVSFEADALDLALPATPPQEFLQAVHAGDTGATVLLATGPRFALHRASTSQPDAGSSRLVVELLPAGTELAPPPVDPPPPPDLPPPVLPAPTTGVRTVVIDAGHGGDEAGAHGARGTIEKHVTLAVARRLRTIIESRLGLRVFLTRDDDRTLSLDERSAYANSQKADVFVSIHANAAVRPALRGAEVYSLSPDAADEAARRAVESSSAVLPVMGGGVRRIDLIPWEIAQARYVERSSTLANFVEQSLRARVDMSSRPIQQGPFRVLVGANMPAVLVEIGYLSNEGQEQELQSGAYQDQIAQALFEAIVRFREHVGRSGE